MWLTYLHLILSSLFPIYIASHASLTRPSTAAKSGNNAGSLLSEEHEEEDEVYQRMEGLAPLDAIFFPLLAGLTLGGLYLIIKWLEDPAILNRILGWYFGVFSVLGIAKLIGDVLTVMHSFVFPKWYADKGLIWQVDGTKRHAVPLPRIEGMPSCEQDAGVIRPSPLPGRFGRHSVPANVNNMLWLGRQLLAKRITFKLYIHRTMARRAHFSPYTMIGFIVGLAAAAYSNFIAKPWWLTNISGFAFSYTALQLMSPTTFGTGSLILAALFCYDIYMVFFTPMMVTVATALDIPIKLEFPRPAGPGEKPGNAMLGLGDVVLPGLMIGLALRFDLYLHYLRQQEHLASASQASDANVGTEVQKPTYIPPGKNWSNHFWTTSWLGSPIYPSAKLKTGAFKKFYFHASLIGYVLGMLTTLAAMEYSKHAQPALLYLVPGVLGSLWLSALVKGEVKLMYAFTEAVEEQRESSTNSEATKKEDELRHPEQRSSFFSFASQKKNETKLAEGISRHVESGETDDGSDVDVKSISSSSSHSAAGKGSESLVQAGRRKDSLHREKNRDWFYFAISDYAPLKKTGAAAKQRSVILQSGRAADGNMEACDDTSACSTGATTEAGRDNVLPKRRRKG